MKKEAIWREDLLKQIDADSKGNEGQYGDEWEFIDTIKMMPTADVVEREMTEEVREAIMRLSMCSRHECRMCQYRLTDDVDECRDRATKCMNTIVDAFTERKQAHGIVAHINIDTDELLERIMNEYEIEERKRGAWIEEDGDCEGKSVIYICSQCGDDDGWINYNFCPNCGADMRGSDNE